MVVPEAPRVRDRGYGLKKTGRPAEPGLPGAIAS